MHTLHVCMIRAVLYLEARVELGITPSRSISHNKRALVLANGPGRLVGWLEGAA